MGDRIDECGHHATKVGSALRNTEPEAKPHGITRRTFGVAATGAILASALPLLGSSKLRIGIGTYSYHNLSLDEMIVQLRALRISEIEMSRGEFMLMNHPTEEMCRAARAQFDRAGIHCVSYYSATIKEDQELEKAIKFAQILGAKNISGDATGDILKRIDQGCAQAGLTFGIHNHFFKGERFAYETPDDVLKALDGLSSTMGSTADVGHFASCGQDPVEALRRLRPHLKLVHLKDIEAAGGEVNVLLGKGISHIPEVIKELRRQDFRNLVAIEYEKDGDINKDMQFDVELARRLS